MPKIEARSSTEDLQFELFLSYIHHASGKLAFRESELMLQSTHFINFMTSSQEKNSTEPSTTEASFENRIPGIE
jgi:hypothetical protein